MISFSCGTGICVGMYRYRGIGIGKYTSKGICVGMCTYM
jgi:hypothetical protein